MENNFKTFCLSLQHLAGFSIMKQTENKYYCSALNVAIARKKKLKSLQIP
jgi:hypothetical protein